MLNLSVYPNGVRCKVVLVANASCGVVNLSLGNLSSQLGGLCEIEVNKIYKK